MRWALKFFSWSALVDFIVRAKLGDKLWNIVRDAVSAAEQQFPEGHGPEKFARVMAEAKVAAIQIGKFAGEGLLRFAIEAAVRILTEKTA